MTRKAINFDLSTNELKKYFKDTREPYHQIKNFMLDNGFEHSQYSGYHSIEPMDNKKIASILKDLSKNFPWLSTCLQKFHVTEIGEVYDVKDTIIEMAKSQLTPTQTPLTQESKQKLRQRYLTSYKKTSSLNNTKEKNNDLEIN